MTPTKVFCVIGHTMICDLLVEKINTAIDLVCVGGVGGRPFDPSQPAFLEAEIIIVDLSITYLSPLALVRDLVARAATVKVVALSAAGDLSSVVDALRAGCVGFVDLCSETDELLRALRAVRGNQLFVSSRLNSRLIEHLIIGDRAGDRLATAADAADFASPNADSEAAPDRLTRRETAVLRLVADGFSSKEIAAQLHISARTVDVHRARVMEKVGLNDVANLTKFALVHGLTNLSSIRRDPTLVGRD